MDAALEQQWLSRSVHSTACLQADYELDNAEDVGLINRESAKLAKQACERYMAAHPGERKFVAGAMGPTNKTLSVSPSVENPAFRGVTYDKIEAAYYAQARARSGPESAAKEHWAPSTRRSACCPVWRTPASEERPTKRLRLPTMLRHALLCSTCLAQQKIPPARR